jgi:hypothetical protein
MISPAATAVTAPVQVLRSPTGRVLAGCAGAAAVICSLGHVYLLVFGGAAHGGMSMVVMIILSAVCLLCARHLWIHPDVRAWLVLGLMNVLMLMVHSVAMTSSGSGHSEHAAHAAMTPASLAQAQMHTHGQLPVTLLTVMAIGQIIVAMVMLSWARRTSTTNPRYSRPQQAFER